MMVVVANDLPDGMDVFPCQLKPAALFTPNPLFLVHVGLPYAIFLMLLSMSLDH